ncbi:MAG: hypothetical protein H6581_11830 [Bacteroidia bacterium]|nr:hypothetical protein [Bacteroidia bacterium]
MKNLTSCLTLILTISLLSACKSHNEKEYTKGFSLNETVAEENDTPTDGPGATSELITRPGNVVLTGQPGHRLIPVYKLNWSKRSKEWFTGDNSFYQSYTFSSGSKENAWHYHYLPGIEALHGYNMLNISHYDLATQQRKNLFENPGLIRTVYFPALEPDTLNGMPVRRDYYLVSIYDEDTNNDTLVNMGDLRRFYYFDLNGDHKTRLIPPEYCVLSSEYDYPNDILYIVARLDKNGNGQSEVEEPSHIFWIDLKKPQVATRMY